MAVARVNRDWKEVVTKKKVRTGVILDLTNEEAITLRSVLRSIAGCEDYSARHFTEQIGQALDMADVPWRDDCTSGQIVLVAGSRSAIVSAASKVVHL